jgi:hypothetical protein
MQTNLRDGVGCHVQPKGDDIIGIQAHVQVEKSKGYMLDVSEPVGIVLKKDSRYSFGETRLGQG